MSLSLNPLHFFDTWDCTRGSFSKFLLLMAKKPARPDINNRSKDLMIFFKSAIALRILVTFDIPNKITKWQEKTWLFVSIDTPTLQYNQCLHDSLIVLLHFLSWEYVKKVVIEDFNLNTSNPSLKPFMKSQKFTN